MRILKSLELGRSHCGNTPQVISKDYMKTHVYCRGKRPHFISAPFLLMLDFQLVVTTNALHKVVKRLPLFPAQVLQ